MFKPEHGDCTLCTKCGGVIEYYVYSQWNGAEYDVLGTWWSHHDHPEDGHDAETAYG